MPFGSSHHHLPFGGTMSLSTETYYRAIYDLTESLITSGFRRIFILNGHGGNHELVQLVARDLALKHPANIAAGSYWTIAWDALVEVHGARAGQVARSRRSLRDLTDARAATYTGSPAVAPSRGRDHG